MRLMTSSRSRAIASSFGGLGMAKEPGAIKRLKVYSRKPLADKAAYDTAMKALHGESDRAFVIVATTILEDALLDKLRGQLSPFPEPAAFDRLFQFDGPLGSFSQRIDMACALDVITPETRDDLHILRHMRNACAHSPLPIDLMTPVLWDVARLLFTREGGLLHHFEIGAKAHGRPLPPDSRQHRRELIDLAITLLWLTIHSGSERAMASLMLDHLRSLPEEKTELAPHPSPDKPQ